MKPAQYLIAPAGSGKTYILGALLRRILDKDWVKSKTISPWPIIYVTKASVVEQTKRVLEKDFGIDIYNQVTVLGIDQLRARFGKMFVTEKMTILNGEEHFFYAWTPLINPVLIIWDEAHALKNYGSGQHKIACSYSQLDNVYQIFSSATPATRVSEFKCFVLACKLKYNIPGVGNVLINDNTWTDFAKHVARGDPEEYNQAAVDRMTDILEPYIIRVKGIKPQFRAHNRTEIIDFVTNEGRQAYKSAYDRFLIRKAKAEGRIAEGSGSKMEILVALLQYNIAAESNDDRATIIADRMYQDVKNGFAPACAMKFKVSISKILKRLFDRGVKREEISVIWGGSQVNTSKKAQAKKAIVGNEELIKALEAEGISLDAIGLGEQVELQEEIKFPPEFRLDGSQSQEQRQEEIDRFQKGISKYCFFTMRAGGVGLSLHHTDASIPDSLKRQAQAYLESVKDNEDLDYILGNIKKSKPENIKNALDRWNNYGDRIPLEYRKHLVPLLKCRRKESGYVVEEDIQFVPTRPRKLYSAPNYSAIDMVQTLGRCPRLTSLSNTDQVMLFFRATIEEDVAQICSNKLRCLSKVNRQKEDWHDVILGNDSSRRMIVKDHLERTPIEKVSEEDESGIIEESDENGDNDK